MKHYESGGNFMKLIDFWLKYCENTKASICKTISSTIVALMCRIRFLFEVEDLKIAFTTAAIFIFV